MIYELISLPYHSDRGKLTKHQVEEYLAWYVGNLPIRIDVLQKAVRSTEGYESWSADVKPESLYLLGQWFSNVVQTRPKTEHELIELYANSPDWFKSIKVSDWQLTNQTISIAYDVGMYFGHLVHLSAPLCKWQIERSPKSAHYNQPVLFRDNNHVLSSFNIAMTYAYGVPRGTRRPERLFELYDIWRLILTE